MKTAVFPVTENPVNKNNGQGVTFCRAHSSYPHKRKGDKMDNQKCGCSKEFSTNADVCSMFMGMAAAFMISSGANQAWACDDGCPCKNSKEATTVNKKQDCSCGQKKGDRKNAKDDSHHQEAVKAAPESTQPAK